MKAIPKPVGIVEAFNLHSDFHKKKKLSSAGLESTFGEVTLADIGKAAAWLWKVTMEKKKISLVKNEARNKICDLKIVKNR